MPSALMLTQMKKKAGRISSRAIHARAGRSAATRAAFAVASPTERTAVLATFIAEPATAAARAFAARAAREAPRYATRAVSAMRSRCGRPGGCPFGGWVVGSWGMGILQEVGKKQRRLGAAP